MDVSASIGHCFECRLPVVMVNGAAQNPTTDNSAVLVLDMGPHGPRMTWHYRTCEIVCTYWEDCGTIDTTA